MSVLAQSRTVICTDVVGSSTGESFRQKYLDDRHRDVVNQAIDAVRDPRYPIAGSFRRVDGDSMTMVVDAGVPRSWLLADFLMRELVVALSEVNRTARADCRLRLRVAVDHGETVLRPPNVEGDPVTRTARLRDSAALRDHMAGTAAHLGLIVSDAYYSAVVVHRERGLDPALFSSARVIGKRFDERAWLWRTGERETPRAEQARPAEPSAHVTNTFDGTTYVSKSVFGVVRSHGD